MHICVIESVNKDGAKVAYLVQSNAKNKAHWIFPKSATTFQTPKEKIIAIYVCVEYGCATIIRCKVSEKTVSAVDHLFNKYEKSLNYTNQSKEDKECSMLVLVSNKSKKIFLK